MLSTTSRVILSRNYPGILTLARLNPSQKRSYAARPSGGGIVGLGKKKLGKAGPMLEKKILPVETNPEKLATYLCGSNLNKEGGEDIKLKDDSEYPDWLWTLNTGKPLSLDELDPDTEEFWDQAKRLSKRRSTAMMRLKKF